MPPASPTEHEAFDQEYDQAAHNLGVALERYLSGDTSAANLLSTADVAMTYGVGIADAAHQLRLDHQRKALANAHGSAYWQRWYAWYAPI